MKRRWLTIIGIIVLLGTLSFVVPDKPLVSYSNDKIESLEKNGQEQEEEITDSESFVEGAFAGLKQFLQYSGFANATFKHLIMLVVGLIFIFLAIKYDYEPLLLIPIGVGILIGNIPFVQGAGLKLGIYEEGSVLNYLYFGVTQGIYPPLIFLGLGAMTDFSSLMSNPRLMILGAAAQVGIFLTFLGALVLG